MRKLALNPDVKKIQQLVSSRLYSDKYHFITEVVSNAKDAHTRIGQTKAIEVKLYYVGTQNCLEVRDYGCSMTPDEFLAKVGVLAYSDKETEDDTIGNKGIGSIAFTAFSPIAYYTCIKNGKKFTAKIEEKEDGIEVDDEFNLEDTADEQGVIFKIFFLSTVDRTGLLNKIKEKLSYFGGVVFDLCGDLSLNTRSIYRNDLFQVSELSSHREMHITLDDVVYNINWNKLGISQIPLPVAVRFTLKDGIDVSTTRESVIYTDSFIKLLNKRIIETCTAIVDRYNESIDKPLCLEDFIVESGKSPVLHVGSITLIIKQASSHSTSQINTLKLLGCSDQKYAHILASAFTSYKANSMWRVVYGKSCPFYDNHLNYRPYETTVITHNRELSNKMLKYLRWRTKKEKPIRVFRCLSPSLKHYKEILNLKKSVPKNKWRSLICDFQNLEKEYLSKFTNLDTIEFPEEFLNSIKITRKKLQKNEGDISIRRVFHTKEVVLSTAPLNSLYKNPGLNIYSTKEDKEILQKLDRAFSRTIRFLVLNKSEISKIKSLNLHNYMELSELKNKKCRVISKVIAANEIRKLMNTYYQIFDNLSFINIYLSKSFGEDCKKLIEYYNSHKSYYQSDDELFEELSQYVLDLGWIDPNISDVIDRVKVICPSFEFLDALDLPKVMDFSKIDPSSSYYSHVQKVVNLSREILKNRKVRMRWEAYLPDLQIDDQKNVEIVETE